MFQEVASLFRFIQAAQSEIVAKARGAEPGLLGGAPLGVQWLGAEAAGLPHSPRGRGSGGKNISPGASAREEIT